MSTAATTPSVPEVAAEPPPQKLPLARLALLWLVAANLRSVILALAPVLPTIRHQFNLNETEVGLLTTLPVLLLGLGAAAGSIAVARIGPRLALGVSLLVVGAASALRAAGGVGFLFGASVVLGLAIGVAQPVLPSLAKTWFGAKVGLATAIYGNGFIVGEAVAASITLPFLVPLVGGWQGAVALWSLPCLVAVVWLASPTGRGGSPVRLEGPVGWSPMFGDGRTWRLGLLQGGGSALYFGTNALLPTELHAVGKGGLVAGCLAALNVSQLLAAVIVGVLSRRRAKALPLMLCCAIAALVGLGMIAFLPSWAVIVGSGIVGVASACCFVVALVLPAVVAEHDEVHRVAAGMFTIGYSVAFVLPLLGGAIWDASGQPRTALLPGALGSVLFGVALVGRRSTIERPRSAQVSRLG